MGGLSARLSFRTQKRDILQASLHPATRVLCCASVALVNPHRSALQWTRSSASWHQGKGECRRSRKGRQPWSDRVRLRSLDVTRRAMGPLRSAFGKRLWGQHGRRTCGGSCDGLNRGHRAELRWGPHTWGALCKYLLLNDGGDGDERKDLRAVYQAALLGVGDWMWQWGGRVGEEGDLLFLSGATRGMAVRWGPPGGAGLGPES